MRLERMTLALFYEKVLLFYTDISKYQNHRMICTVFSVIKVHCSNQLSYYRIVILQIYPDSNGKFQIQSLTCYRLHYKSICCLLKIRTLTRRTKIFCATITPKDNLSEQTESNCHLLLTSDIRLQKADVLTIVLCSHKKFVDSRNQDYSENQEYI